MRDYRLDLLRLSCNLLIVFFHVTSIPGITGSVLSSYIYRGFCWAMPTFFVLTGYLLMRGLTSDTYKAKMLRRVRSLLVPFLIWNFIYGLAGVLAGESHFDSLLIRQMLGLSTWTACPHFWYIREILVLAVVSPVFVYLFKTKGRKVALVLGLVGYSIFSAKMGWDAGCGEKRLSSYSLVCFTTGGYLAYCGADLLNVAHKYRWPLIISGLIAAFPISHDVRWFGFLSMGLFASIISFFQENAPKFTFNPCYKFLLDSAFFLFAIHLMLIRGVPKKLLDALSLVQDTPVLLMFIIGVLIVFLCLVIRVVVRLVCPPFERMLSGRF